MRFTCGSPKSYTTVSRQFLDGILAKRISKNLAFCSQNERILDRDWSYRFMFCHLLLLFWLPLPLLMLNSAQQAHYKLPKREQALLPLINLCHTITYTFIYMRCCFREFLPAASSQSINITSLCRKGRWTETEPHAYSWQIGMFSSESYHVLAEQIILLV